MIRRLALLLVLALLPSLAGAQVIRYIAPAGGVSVGSFSANCIPYAGTSSALTCSPLYRENANTVSQRNGTAAQAFNIYNTYTDASNGEWGGLSWGIQPNEFRVFTKSQGTGTQRHLVFATGAADTGRWYIDATAGHLKAYADNTYDIGANSATRPRRIYVGTSYVGANGSLWADSGGDGIWTLYNSAATGVDRLQWGGTSTAFSAISLSAAVASQAQGLIIQRADGTPQTFANLGAATNGAMIYCSDCTRTDPCAGSGTGAYAKRLNGTWVCN